MSPDPAHRLRRVALLTHEFAPFRGGIGRVAEGLALGGTAEGREVVVVAPDYGGEGGEGDAERPYRVVRFPGRHCSIVSQRKLGRYALRLRRLLPELDPDVVHAVCPASQMAVTALSWFGAVPAPWSFTVHGTELIRYRDEAIPRLWMRRSFRRTLGVAAVSEAVRRRLTDDFPLPAEKSFVSRPGIEAIWHETPPTDRGATRADLGVGPGDLVVLTVARRVREKGHDRVIRGIGALPEGLRSRMPYVVAGTGPDGWARELRALADREGVRLHLTGKVPDEAMVELCDAADLFAMLSRRTPTRLEGLGLTYLEAGRRGCPSLACDTGGVSEAVRDGETGLLLPEDPATDAVAAALARFAEDAELLERTGAAAVRWAEEFTDRRHAREVFGALEGRLAGR